METAVIQKALASATCTTPKEEFLNKAYANLTARIYDQADGMLVCLAARSGASAEALARVVMEGSINLFYSSVYGLEAPLLGYFERWLNEHSDKLNKWKVNASNLVRDANEITLIERRIEMLYILRRFFDSAIDELGLDNKPNSWPKNLFDRFKAVEMEVDYYTSYHRLSSASHLAAEETLIWLFGYSHMDTSVMEKLSFEAVSSSIMMSRIAVIYYIQSLTAFCLANNFSEPLEILKRHKHNLHIAFEEIAKDAGCPI